MGLFDSLRGQAESAIRSSVNKTANQAVNKAVSQIGKGRNKSEKFTFLSVPTNVEELKALKEAVLDTPFKTAALTMLVLKMHESDKAACYEMMDFLRGPEPTSTYAKDFIDERLANKEYIVNSFFEGATVENNYTPSNPLTIAISENVYSFDTENWATLWVNSAGADSPRPIKFRKKPSTGQWFLNDVQCLSEIRQPVEADPWA